MEKSVFTIVAGANGSGKSSLYEDVLSPNTVYFNGDLIFEQLQKKYVNISKESVGGAVASVLERTVLNAIESKKNFAFETNFSVRMAVDMLKNFKENGFETNLIYVGINSTDIAKERVNIRTLKGGHDIPDDLIKFNYEEGCKNVNKYLPHFDRIVFVDNSSNIGKSKIVAEYDKKLQTKIILNEKIEWFNKNFRENFLNLKAENQIDT
ncbi:MAG: zeta toxin family protein [Prevotellaceae bacterium]|jgi:predicted ABC-type ATPase|nr:zeta toxin family protein [Prevotellaceae bacterium]